MTVQMDVTVERDRGTARVMVVGEIDLATADRLREVLIAELESSPSVHIDLGGCTFIDSVGLSVLVEAARQRTNGSEPALAITSPSAPVRRLIELTQLDSLVPVLDSASEPLSA